RTLPAPAAWPGFRGSRCRHRHIEWLRQQTASWPSSEQIQKHQGRDSGSATPVGERIFLCLSCHEKLGKTSSSSKLVPLLCSLGPVHDLNCRFFSLSEAATRDRMRQVSGTTCANKTASLLTTNLPEHLK